MKITLKIQRGINQTPKKIGDLPLNAETIGTTSEWAGSYHILFMKQHYRSYLSSQFPHFQPNMFFPHLDNFSQLTIKNPSQQVIGNIGECVAAIFARNKLHADIPDIHLLKTKRKIKIPDYLMKLDGDHIRYQFPRLIPSAVDPYFNTKSWWPVESKATSNIQETDPRKKAIKQLISFWYHEKAKLQNSLGYGMIVTFVYEEPYQVIVSLILPKKPERLRKYFEDHPYTSEDDLFFQESARFLYGCNI